MPSREQMMRLIQAHNNLPEPMETAIWIRQDMPGAWLVEVIPDLSTNDRPNEPISFNAGRDFRFPLHLIAGNREDVERAVREDPQLADWIARGEILHGEMGGRQLKELAHGYVHA
jgi:hypothetical protein